MVRCYGEVLIVFVVQNQGRCDFASVSGSASPMALDYAPMDLNRAVGRLGSQRERRVDK